MNDFDIFTDDTHETLKRDSMPYRLRNLASAFRMNPERHPKRDAATLDAAADLLVEEALRRINERAKP